MSFREITMQDVSEVLRRWQTGQSARRIARETGLDRKTVARYLKEAQEGGLVADMVVTEEVWRGRLIRWVAATGAAACRWEPKGAALWPPPGKPGSCLPRRCPAWTTPAAGGPGRRIAPPAAGVGRLRLRRADGPGRGHARHRHGARPRWDAPAVAGPARAGVGRQRTPPAGVHPARPARRHPHHRRPADGARRGRAAGRLRLRRHRPGRRATSAATSTRPRRVVTAPWPAAS